MTDIFTARDKMVAATMHFLDLRAGDTPFPTDVLWSMREAETEAFEAAKKFWELTRGRKWPA